jgi:hypothetical protein
MSGRYVPAHLGLKGAIGAIQKRIFADQVRMMIGAGPISRVVSPIRK